MFPNSPSRWLMAIVVTAMIVLLAGGVWFYRSQQHELQQQAEDELQAVAQLKVDQIVAWRAERLGDAALITESPLFVEGVAQWLANPQAGDTASILAQFRALQTHYNYYNVALVDVDGNVLLSLDGEEGLIHEEAQKTLAAALLNEQSMLTALHPGPGDLPPHIGAIAPLFARTDPAAEAIGAIILQSDASQFLYPLIQSWPTPSRSAETLLVRRDGDSVLFLNELRHQKGTALTLQFPLEQIDLPAAKTVGGYEGITQGRDYRDVEIVAAVQAIPDSPWFIVSKMDKNEIFADWQLYSRLIGGLILGSLVTVGATGGTVWQRNQRIHYQKLFQAEKAHQETEARYQTTLMSIGDGVIVTDANGRVLLLNPVAEKLTGWAQDDASGKPLEDIFRIINEETRQPVDNPVRRVMHEGAVVGLANHTLLITRDGQEFPIADSGAPIHDASGNLTGAVLVFRDQTKERAAQKALEESEAHLRKILDNLPVGVAVNSVFPEIAFSYMNDNFPKCYRTTREALSEPDSFWEAAYQDAEYREVIRSNVLKDIASGDPARMFWEDIPITREGEETTYLSAKNTPLQGTQLMLSTVWDTTERKRAEEKLRESEERFRRAVADAPLPMLIHAEDGEIVVVNQVWTKITGYSHADIPTIDAWTERAYGERKAIVQEDIDRLYGMQEKRSEGEYVITTHGGQQRIWDFSSSPVGRLPDGRRLVLSMAMDVTDRKQAEETMRRYADRLTATNRLERIIASSIDITRVYDNFVKELLALIPLDRTSIVLLDDERDHWYIAHQWTQHEPKFASEVRRSVKGSVIEWIVNHRTSLLENKIGEHGDWPETELLRREGIQSRLLLPLVIEDQVIGVFTAGSSQANAISAEDRSILEAIAYQLAVAIQNARLYAEVQRYATDLEQRVADRTAQLEAFSYSVSHDLRAPLRAMDGFSRILLEDYAPDLPDEVQRYLGLVRSSAQQMGNLIDHLLAFSRLGRQPLKKQRVMPGELVEDVLTELSHEQADREVEITVEDLPPCQADPTLLRQVFVNLLQNALKFTKQRDVARIEVGFDDQYGEQAYFVKDNGVGFDMQYADKLFGVFQRLHRVEDYEGTGVGLATVQRIVHRHGGRVWADAAVDQGATFYFTIEGADAP